MRSVAIGEGRPVSIKSDEALVYYYGFEVDPIAGLQEKNIDEMGCKYRINTARFLRSLHAVPAGKEYQKSNVRAKVVVSPTEIYYIDKLGVVRAGTRKFKIDTNLFAEYIKPIGRKCH